MEKGLKEHDFFFLMLECTQDGGVCGSYVVVVLVVKNRVHRRFINWWRFIRRL